VQALTFVEQLLIAARAIDQYNACLLYCLTPLYAFIDEWWVATKGHNDECKALAKDGLINVAVAPVVKVKYKQFGSAPKNYVPSSAQDWLWDLFCAGIGPRKAWMALVGLSEETSKTVKNIELRKQLEPPRPPKGVDRGNGRWVPSWEYVSGLAVSQIAAMQRRHNAHARHHRPHILIALHFLQRIWSKGQNLAPGEREAVEEEVSAIRNSDDHLLFYQEQKCNCTTRLPTALPTGPGVSAENPKAASKLGEAYCSGGNGCQKFQLAWMESWQLAAMKQSPRRVWEVDATHSVTSLGWCLTTVLVKNKGGKGVPIAWMVSQVDDEASIVRLLRSVAGAGGHWPRRVVIDKSDAAMNAIKTLRGSTRRKEHGAPPEDFDFVLCQFHVMQAVKRWYYQPLTCFTSNSGLCSITQVRCEEEWCEQRRVGASSSILSDDAYGGSP
jgi:hypothetical protein